MNISTRQVDAFLALAAQRSFTRAAAQCHLSQPAFSALIRALEDDLGLRLFDRSTRHVSLTAEGENFHASALRIRAEVDAALATLRDAALLRRGRVSVALLPSLAAGWLPGVLAGFRAQHPGVELDIADVLSEPCIERVATGKADFALAAIRADTPELQAEPFCEDVFHLVCRADHPLARQPLPAGRRSAAAQWRALAEWPFIHLARHSSVRQYLEAAFHPHAMRTLMEVEQLATVMGMVRAGLGISVVPTLTLFHFQQEGLATRPLALPGLTRQIYLVRRRDRGLSVAAQALYARVMQQRPMHAEMPSKQ
ncbi:LysR family transcriptional regulator [[Acidovorax] ebreus]|uniref:Transcriptional regulator, LysR family n=1 Tax=Acidovorax ebreus (strain TPSY) TaxID=535289 RepID=A0A9J9Q7H8_ACIET|nr:LysR family transcriptional regulator [[Acidovorax] ebreus]ACM33368.1 transcriptional regulator, LysR family [[Acidovorax] ebreus TPSY]